MGQVVTEEKIRQAKDFYKLHFGYSLFNEEGQCHLVTSLRDISAMSIFFSLFVHLPMLNVL